MIFKKKNDNHRVPGLNTASLPDLIFTVLFFFMIVTNMRHDEVRVQVTEPDGKELSQLMRKNLATYIYIGRPFDKTLATKDTFQIQVDNTYMSASDIIVYLQEKKKSMEATDAEKMVVNIKADKDVPMHIIKEVKESLKKSNTLIVHYSANEKDGKGNNGRNR